MLASENAAGYANARPVRMPCGGFTLTVTTLQFRHQLPYEAIGLAQTLRRRQAEAGR